jgi:hypothetical protein
MKKISTLLLSFFFLSLTSYSQIRYLKGILQASQEGGSVSSFGGGTVIVKYNSTTRMVEHFGNYRNLTANITNQHIHIGAPGVSGPPVVQLASTGGTAGELTGSQVLTAEQEAALLAGNTYTNVHTSTYTGGEIRAQLTLATEGQTEFLKARIQSAQQVPPNGSLATGRSIVLLDKGKDSVWVTGTYAGLTSAASMAHIHLGQPHENGDIIIPLQFVSATAGSIDTAVSVSAAHETAIITNATYINIHTTTLPGGEIRGQVSSLNEFVYFANPLQGTQEAPPNTSTARGTVIAGYNPETNVFELAGDYQNLSATISGSHIHGPATPGNNAGILFDVTNTGGRMGTLLRASTTITEAQEADLLAGLWYVNVHSTGTYAAGEIRAQLVPTTRGETQLISGQLQASQSVATPPVISGGTGDVAVLLDKVTRNIYVTGYYTGLTSGAREAHIHHGQAGTNGPISFGLNVIVGTPAGTVTGSGVVSQTLADSIINGLTYINIHTNNFRGGEVRAQLGNLVLPLKLKYLNGYKQSNKVTLVWESAEEQNLSHYEVEQLGQQAGEWIKKATIFAKGGK